jgi:hypothetical protein
MRSGIRKRVGSGCSKVKRLACSHREHGVVNGWRVSGARQGYNRLGPQPDPHQGRHELIDGHGIVDVGRNHAEVRDLLVSNDVHHVILEHVSRVGHCHEQHDAAERHRMEVQVVLGVTNERTEFAFARDNSHLQRQWCVRACVRQSVHTT